METITPQLMQIVKSFQLFLPSLLCILLWILDRNWKRGYFKPGFCSRRRVEAP